MSDEFPQVKEVVRGILPSDEAQHDGSEHHADCSSEQQPVTTADILFERNNSSRYNCL